MALRPKGPGRWGGLPCRPLGREGRGRAGAWAAAGETLPVDPGLMQDSAEQTFHRSSCAFLRTYLGTQSF